MHSEAFYGALATIFKVDVYVHVYDINLYICRLYVSILFSD